MKRSYENLLSLSKASVLVLAKPHLAHKPCRPGDEDRLVFVKSCNRTQTWRLFHLVASFHIRSVCFSFPTSSLSLPLEKLSIPLPRRPLLMEEDILSFNLLQSLAFLFCSVLPNQFWNCTQDMEQQYMINQGFTHHEGS